MASNLSRQWGLFNVKWFNLILGRDWLLTGNYINICAYVYIVTVQRRGAAGLVTDLRNKERQLKTWRSKCFWWFLSCWWSLALFNIQWRLSTEFSLRVEDSFLPQRFVAFFSRKCSKTRSNLRLFAAQILINSIPHYSRSLYSLPFRFL